MDRTTRFKRPPPSIGFVSRGDTQLLSVDVRHRFFNDILHQFVVYCSKNTKAALTDDLRTTIASVGPLPPATPSVSIESILTSLRKLREALISRPVDDFCKKVFLFSIRISATIGHYHTYIPSINFLLRADISADELREIASLLVLHIAHFNKHYNHALRLFFNHLDRTKDRRILRIITSFIHRDYHTWVLLYNAERNPAFFAAMTFGRSDISSHMGNAITNAYFNMGRSALEAKLPSKVSLDDMLKTHSWTVDNDNVVIRQRRR